jgi:pimeloyl-ACP methyl ester carboxylesterase
MVDTCLMLEENEGVLEIPGGRQIGWMTRGATGGTPIGYLHGQPGSRRDLRLVEAGLLEQENVLLFSVDRGGYGDTSPAGLDRRDVAADLVTVADHLGIGDFAVLAASMGAIYALTLAATHPGRVTKIVLISGHVLPYDDPAVEARLSEAEQADLALLRAGPSRELDGEYAAASASFSDVEGAVELMNRLSASMSTLEQRLVASEFAHRAAESFSHGASGGHRGYLDDGLRTIRPLEVDLSLVTCPVRALHGEDDDLEPYANLRRLVPQLSDVAVLALPGMGHFGPWVWPGLAFALIADE